MEESLKNDENTTTFKKPIFIGKVGRLPRKTHISLVPDNSKKVVEEVKTEEFSLKEAKESEEIPEGNQNEESELTETKESTVNLTYIEPTWSGLPTTKTEYKFEVLKSGVIIETVNLMKKPYWTFGRQPTCDIFMAHPTISRFHAILQYKVDGSGDRPVGFYIYDLGSTHGTFLNKNRIKSKLYVRIQVGHMLKLGCSTRSYLLTGPEEDIETETELTVTELKQKRAQELKERAEKELREAQALDERNAKEEERGIDWGMGEDADEETDLSENPYAETNNEQLYLDDPKRTLRGFMEREGHELHYEVNERGIGQFLCSVTLPIDDANGRAYVAEALVKGKKKEAVVQCALEACRILDRHGVLRQATHESRKRKVKNWEENDYYDSDEDTFLDRTGTIERKREWRMKSKQPQQPETYQSLVEKEENLSNKICEIEKQLREITAGNLNRNNSKAEEVDSLDYFMNELNSNKPDKFAVVKLKSELNRLRKDQENVIKMVNIARPAHLPPLVRNEQQAPSTSCVKAKMSLPIFGKRLKVKVTLPARESEQENTNDVDEDEKEKDSTLVDQNFITKLRKILEENQQMLAEQKKKLQKQINNDNQNIFLKIIIDIYKIFDQNLKFTINDIDKDELTIIVDKLLKMFVKFNKLLNSITNNEINEKLRELHEVNNNILIKTNERLEKSKNMEPTDMLEQIIEANNRIKTFLKIISKIFEERSNNNSDKKSKIDDNSVLNCEGSSDRDEDAVAAEERKRKKNLRRIMQRQEKLEVEKKKQYEEDAKKEDYNMWLPPENQSGDGRTALNDKFGY